MAAFQGGKNVEAKTANVPLVTKTNVLPDIDSPTKGNFSTTEETRFSFYADAVNTNT